MSDASTVPRLRLNKETLKSFVGRGPSSAKGDGPTFSGQCTGTSDCTRQNGWTTIIGCTNCAGSDFCSTGCCDT